MSRLIDYWIDGDGNLVEKVEGICIMTGARERFLIVYAEDGVGRVENLGPS